MYAVARKVVGDNEEARDVAQEVFIKLHGALNSFDTRQRFTTWLYRLTVNLAIDHRRKRQVRLTVPLDSVAEIPDGAGTPLPDEEAEGRAFRGEIESIAQGLTDRQRTAFFLRDLEDFTTAEVAAIMECRESTVRVHLAKAREVIRNELIKRYPDRFGGYHHTTPGKRP